MRVWFTSDNHFCHKAVIGFCKRPYKDLLEMHNGMIDNWNRVVRPDDTVIVVGDFCFGNSHNRQYILSKLNGVKILVQGNHDKGKGQMRGFDLMVQRLNIRIAGQTVTVSHYPLKYNFLKSAWAWFVQKRKPKYLDRCDVDRGQYHIHGHTHHTERFNENQIHVGVDAWNFTPVALDTIAKYIHRRESNGKANR